MASPIFARDTLAEVALGNVHGYSSINKFGHNPAAGTSAEDVWAAGGTYAFYPTTAQAMEVVSTSVEDDPEKADTNPGTGAWTVQVYGLDSDWVEQTETVTLNGTGVVALANTYIRMYRAIVLTAGTGETNAGNIIVRIASAGATGAYIAAGDGQTQQAIYTVPAGKQALFTKGYVAMTDDDKNGTICTFQWKARPNNGATGAWQTKGQASLINIGSSGWQYEYGIPAGPLPAKTDIRIEMSSSEAEVDVVGGFDLVLVDT